MHFYRSAIPVLFARIQFRKRIAELHRPMLPAQRRAARYGNEGRSFRLDQETVLHSIPTIIVLVSMMLYWERIPIGPLSIPLHTISIATTIFYIFFYGKAVVRRNSVSMILLAYVINLIAFSFLVKSLNLVFISRTIYTMILIFVFSFMFRFQALYFKRSIPLAALGAVFVLFFYLYLLGPGREFSIYNAYYNFIVLNFEQAEGEWRKILTVQDFNDPTSDPSNLRNGFASVMFFISCLFLLFPKNTRLRFLILIPISIIFTLTSFSGAILLVLAFLIYHFRVNANIVLFISAFVLIGIFFVSDFSFLDVYNFDNFLGRRIEGTTEDRFEQYIIAINDIYESGFIGYYPGYKIDTHLGELYPHNMFLAVWLNAGLIGEIFYILFYVHLVRSLVKASLAESRENAETLFVLVGAISVLNVVVRALISGPVPEFTDFGGILSLAFFSATQVCFAPSRYSKRIYYFFNTPGIREGR